MASPYVNQKDIAAELKLAFEKGGMKAVNSEASQILDKWKDISLIIAVLGRSGVGKSCLINALMGLEEDDEGAARVGVVETTKTIKSYRHPENKNLVFVDLPGAGTPNFSRSTYLADIGFADYDVFIIVTSNRFCEDDAWLCKEIKNQDKSFVFVRSQIDIDLMKEKRTKKDLFASDEKAAEKCINIIRQDCEKNLKVKNAKVYLVDSYDTQNPLFDFDDLNRFLLNAFPDWKKGAITLAMSNTTAVLIEEKKKVLEKRIYLIALLSGVGGAIPIPGMSVAIDAGIVLGELKFYHTQYGIYKIKEEIQKLEKMSTGKIPMLSKLSEFSTLMSSTALLTKIPAILASEVVELSVSTFLPILGSIIGGALSYGSTVYTLKQVLDKVTKDAHLLNRYIQDKHKETVQDP